jgi:transposase-like protein
MSDVSSLDQDKARRWTELVQAYEMSGQSQRAFCAREGIGQSTLRYWRRRLKGVSGESTGSCGTRLVSVKVREEAPSSEASGLSIVADQGLRIEVSRDFDSATLERLMMSLRRLG